MRRIWFAAVRISPGTLLAAGLAALTAGWAALLAPASLFPPRPAQAPPAVPVPALPPAPEEGHPAPDFTLPDGEGRQVSLSDLQEQPRLVYFWASWCPDCRAHLPGFVAELRPRLEDDGGLALVLVNIMEDAASARQALPPLPPGATALWDRDGQVTALYRVRATPSLFFLDGEGIVRARWFGRPTEAALRGGLAEILPPPAPPGDPPGSEDGLAPVDPTRASW